MKNRFHHDCLDQYAVLLSEDLSNRLWIVICKR
jgi:hypothetical protein